MKKRILIICREDLRIAPRFIMEVDALHSNYALLAAGNTGNERDTRYSFIKLNERSQQSKSPITFHLKYPLVLRKLISAFIKLIHLKRFRDEQDTLYKDIALLSKEPFDLLIVHHMSDLPLAVQLAKQKKLKLIFNAHEYYPLEFEDVEGWMKHEHPLRMKQGNTYFKDVELCFCVGEEIAKKYKKEFNLNSVIVTNSKPFHDLKPKQLGEDGKIRMIHHGAAIRSRKIELTIEMMAHLDERFELNLILVPGDEAYINELRRQAAEYPSIKFLDPVGTADISSFINQFDVGVFLLPPTNFNYKFALPNKFYEFIQARLAMAIGPSPEMANIIYKYDLGVVAKDFEPKTMAQELKTLAPEKIMYYKNKVHNSAQFLSAEETERKIKDAVNALLANKPVSIYN